MAASVIVDLVPLHSPPPEKPTASTLALGPHLASYLMDTESTFPLDKAAWASVQPLASNSFEVKNGGAIPQLPPCVFVTWCLVKQEDNPTFVGAMGDIDHNPHVMKLNAICISLSGHAQNHSNNQLTNYPLV
jgi:hypothetical protein